MKIVFLLILKLFLSCTSNPFWNDPETEQLTLSGTIFSENNTMGTPISVWLETFDRYTTTDENGDFSLIIQNTQSTDGSVSGSLKVYFFIYNYQLDSAEVNFTNGRLSIDQTDFSANGELIKPIELKKILSGEVELELLENDFYDQDTLEIVFDVDIHAAIDIDLYKFIWVEHNFHSGLIFYDVTKDTAILYRFSGYDDYGNIVSDQLRKLSFDMNAESQWQYLIQTEQLFLPSGEYRIVPYFLIDHSFIPQEMIDHMGGEQIFSFSNEYLTIPMDIMTKVVTIN